MQPLVLAWHGVACSVYGALGWDPCGVHHVCKIYEALGLDVCDIFTAFVAFMEHWRCTSGTWVLFLHALHRWVPPGLDYWGSGFSQP